MPSNTVTLMPPNAPVNPPPLYLPEVPEGYHLIVFPDGQQALIPQHLFLDLSQAFAAFRSMQALGVGHSRPRLEQHEDITSEFISEARFSYPPNPLLSDQERLRAHAEVLGLMDKLGISYKDASHRLYMAEIAKLKQADKMSKAMSNLAVAMQQSFQDFQGEFVAADHEGAASQRRE